MRVWLLSVVLLLPVPAKASPQECEWPTPKYAIHSIRLSGLESLSSDEWNEVLKSIAGKGFGDAEELSRVIQDALQQHGFFKVKVGTPAFAAQKDRPCNSPVDAVADADLGHRYRLDDVTFSGAKAFTPKRLRAMMPIASGEVFDIDKIRLGIKNLRDLYGEKGYINFTPVPDTQFDDEHDTIRLNIDLDEGGQFRIDELIILGPESVAEPLYKAWPLKPGAVYDAAAIERFFIENKALMPPGFTPESDFQVKQNNAAKTISFRLILCPKNQVCPQASTEF